MSGSHPAAHRGASPRYMSRASIALAIALSLVAPLAAAPLAAQQVVGHTPEKSPYRDIRPSQHITLIGGYFHTPNDEIGATPRSAPLFGVRYDIPVSGPAEFFARVERVNSRRKAFDPTQPAATRALGEVSAPLYLADLGFALDLTGQRTWHGIIPVFDLGIGLATGGKSADKDPYQFGTQFAINSDLGIRVVPGTGGMELRLMVGNTLFQAHYPSGYFAAPTTGGSPLLGTGTARSGYRSNWSYTAGLAIPLFR